MVGKILKFLASKHQENFFPRWKEYFLFLDYISFNMFKIWRGRGWKTSAYLEASSPFGYYQWKYFMQLILHFTINLKILTLSLRLH